MSHYIDIEENRKLLQEALIKAGKSATPPYDCGPDGDDGRLGDDTARALVRFRKDHRLSGVAVVDAKVLHLLQLDGTPQMGPITNVIGSVLFGLLGNLLNWQLVQGYIRTALISFGTYSGLSVYLGQDNWTTVVGLIMGILAIIWQTLANNQKAKAFEVVKAVDAHPDVTFSPANQNISGKPKLVVAPPKAA